MATILPRRAAFICRSCQKSLGANSPQRQLSSLPAHISRAEVAPRPRTQQSAIFSIQLRHSSILRRPRKGAVAKTAPASAQPKAQAAPKEEDDEDEDADEEEEEVEAEAAAAASLIKTLNPVEVLTSLKEDVHRIISTNAVPPQDNIIQLLDLVYQFSNVLIFGINKGPNEIKSADGEDLVDSIIRDLSEGGSDTPVYIADKEMSGDFRQRAADTVAELTWKLMRDPKVFISEDIVGIYTRIQCLLGKPEYLPEIFDLYAHKKIPVANSSPITYSNTWPKMPKYAVPHTAASLGLEAAILKKNLPLALAIIDTTVATPAFRANKVLRRASLPLAGVGATPILAYAGASYVAATQNTMDFEMSKYTAVAAAMAYIGTLTTIAFVAITTSNDQMERVVWRPGTHLSARWLREEEREFFDRLALAWGFQTKSRWGEEQGEDWQTLRDECGMRDMILDKTDLMEGMQ